MVERDTVTVSMGSSKHTWDEIDSRANSLNLDRSKYIQTLVELDLKHNLLMDHKLLKMLDSGEYKRKLKVIDAVSILFFTAIIILLLLIWYLR
jgi:hypothetical protein